MNKLADIHLGSKQTDAISAPEFTIGLHKQTKRTRREHKSANKTHSNATKAIDPTATATGRGVMADTQTNNEPHISCIDNSDNIQRITNYHQNGNHSQKRGRPTTKSNGNIPKKARTTPTMTTDTPTNDQEETLYRYFNTDGITTTRKRTDHPSASTQRTKTKTNPADDYECRGHTVHVDSVNISSSSSSSSSVYVQDSSMNIALHPHHTRAASDSDDRFHDKRLAFS